MYLIFKITLLTYLLITYLLIKLYIILFKFKLQLLKYVFFATNRQK